MPNIPPYIFGMHDQGGEGLMLNADKRGWVLVTAKVSDAGGDFSGLANAGFGVIVRLNYGYGSDGTLPPSAQYDTFAQMCANYVIGSRGANIWIIGNETNLRSERPGNSDSNPGEVLTPDRVAQSFAKCRAVIKRVPGHGDDWVVNPPPGPWNPETTYPGNPGGDWVKYFQDVLNQCVALGQPPDAIALHTYTHGFDAGWVGSEDKMAPAYPNYHYHFRAYRDFLGAIPVALRSRPVLITETQPAAPGWWQNRNVGWIQAAYAEINAWNAVLTNQPIQSLILFRWERGDDRWSISDKSALLDDFRAAMQNEYRVRMPSAQPVVPAPPPQPQPVPPPKTTTGWCPFAKKRPIIENNYAVGRSGHKVKAVVLHIAAGPMSAVFPTFTDPDRLASAHFCVGKDGSIEQYVSIDDTAYGAGLAYAKNQWLNPRGIPVKPSWPELEPPTNPNMYTISIEHEGQPEDKWTSQMYDANNRLLQWIAKQCNLTYVVHHTLIGHYEINPVDRPNCPGPNVEWDRIAADANRGMVPQDVLDSIQATANEVDQLPINIQSALFKFAQSNALGCPQTDETSFQFGNDVYVCQVFSGGIVYVKKSDWGNVRWVKKPQDAPTPPDPTMLAAVTAAQQVAWMPINTDSAFYEFAQTNNLGCPQTDEFEFTVDDTYVGQVYAGGLVYAKKGDWANITWISKSS